MTTASSSPATPVTREQLEQLGVGPAFSRAWQRMLGTDVERTSVEDAAQAAYTPTGPPLEQLEARIRQWRRDAGTLR